MKSTGCYLVSWDFTNGKDKSVVLIGTQEKGQVTAINMFQGKEAEDIIAKLSKQQEDKK